MAGSQGDDFIDSESLCKPIFYSSEVEEAISQVFQPEQLQNTGPLWSISFTCVRIFCRTKDITMDTIVIQWYVNKWPCIL